MRSLLMGILLMIAAFFGIGLLFFGGVVMFLWNHILPAVFHIGFIGLGQALGIVLLCRILFGWPRRRHSHGPRWHRRQYRRGFSVGPDGRTWYDGRTDYYNDYSGRCDRR